MNKVGKKQRRKGKQKTYFGKVPSVNVAAPLHGKVKPTFGAIVATDIERWSSGACTDTVDDEADCCCPVDCGRADKGFVAAGFTEGVKFSAPSSPNLRLSMSVEPSCNHE